MPIHGSPSYPSESLHPVNKNNLTRTLLSKVELTSEGQTQRSHPTATSNVDRQIMYLNILLCTIN